MKKILAIFLAILLLTVLAACGDPETTGSTPAPTDAPHVHSYTEAVTAPTCLEKGYTTYTCACGDTYTDNEVAATGHSYVETVTKEATCTAEGEKTFTCTCGDTYTENIAILSHAYAETVTASTCTEPGYTTHTCACGDSYTDSPVDALGHDFVNSVCQHCNLKVSEGLSYSLSYTDNSYRVTGIGTCMDTDIVIPDTYNGLPVTEINYYAFEDCTTLTSIVIPNSVTSIGWSAFKGCTGLTHVTLSKNIETLESATFDGCTSLTSITFGEGSQLASIGTFAFQRCSSLATITLPNSVTSIGNWTFYRCSSLSTITLPNSVTSIGDYAFSGCSSLTSITIPDGVTSIGEWTFSYCSDLTNITIPDSITSIGNYAFDGCNSLSFNPYDNGRYLGNQNNPYLVLMEANSTSVDSCIIHDSCKIIFQGAFRFCNLTDLIIPAKVTNIGSSAFSSCDALESIVVDASNTVYHSAGNCLVETATKTLIAGCKNSNIPSDGTVTSICDYAFSGCTGLTGVTIPASVTSIGIGVFDGCDGLESIVVDASNNVYHSAGNCIIETATKILIAGCKNSLIPADGSVTNIGSLAFAGLTNLTDISIPNSVSSIGGHAFSDCENLTSITFNGTMEQWNAIEKDFFWDTYTGNYTVHCTDGDIPKS